MSLPCSPDIRIDELKLDIERLTTLCEMRQKEAQGNQEKYETVTAEYRTTQEALTKIEAQRRSLDRDYQDLLQRYEHSSRVPEGRRFSFPRADGWRVWRRMPRR